MLEKIKYSAPSTRCTIFINPTGIIIIIFVAKNKNKLLLSSRGDEVEVKFALRSHASRRQFKSNKKLLTNNKMAVIPT